MAPSSAERGSSSSHPQGWFYGKLPSFGTCGGRRGSLTMIWETWGGEGPGKVTGVASGWNLRQHGDTSVKEQEMWGSTSNYGRYLQAGRYMDNKIASIKVSGVDFWFGHGPLSFLACIFGDLFFSHGSWCFWISNSTQNRHIRSAGITLVVCGRVSLYLPAHTATPSLPMVPPDIRTSTT